MFLTQKYVAVAGLAGLLTVMLTLIAPSTPAHADTTQPSLEGRLHKRSSNSVADNALSGGDLVPKVSVFPCDWLTHVCVKFNKSETKWIAAHTNALSGGGLAGAGALCSKIPIPFGAVSCVIVVGTAGGALADSFDSAAAKGRCVELHFSTTLMGLTHWKTEGC